MSALAIVVVVLHIISCVTIIAIVLMQSGKSAGLSTAISGSTDTFLSKNKSRSMDARLAKFTKWLAIIFAVLTLCLNFVL